MRVGANYEEQAANVDASGKKVLVEVAGRSPLLRLVGSWEFYCEGAAGSHFAGYGDYSAEKFGELFCDGQTKSGALSFRVAAFYLSKLFEYEVKRICRNTRSRILYRNG